ncbi:hypothetical protein [Haladaptatus cibarius]|uniref:hypothetical protein n=1 Tax=Haladaptatus cibarius TaxID=453847 RepID=UPI0006790448|nr:hypothetical protein [Haladaptatus cibarius]
MDKWWTRRNGFVVTVIAIIVFVVVALLFAPRYTGYSRAEVLGATTVLSTIFTLARHGLALLDFLSPNKAEEDNEQYNELRRELGNAEEDLTEYARVTRILEARDIDPYSLLNSQTDSSHFLLLNFTNQSGPPLPPQNVEKTISEGNELTDGGETTSGKNDSRFIRRAIRDDFDAQAVSAFTWVIPPWVVEEEGLGDATKSDLEEWVQQNIYDRYDEEYRAFMPLIALIDFRRATSRVDEKGKFGTAADKIMAGSDQFTEQDYLKAITAQNVNLLEVVKSGELVYFLPLEIDQTTLEAFSDSNVQEDVMEFVEGSGLNALADGENVPNIVTGLEAVGIERAESLASEINESAKIWKRAISTREN